jgi:transposase
MSKGNYSAVEFQGWFEREARMCRFEGKELVCGVDVAKIAFYAAFLDELDGQADVVYFERDDISEFIEALAGIEADEVTLVVEPTGTYGDVLIEKAFEAGFEVISISGAQVKDARKLFDRVPSSHDGKCATLLAHLYLCGVGQPWKRRSETMRNHRSLLELHNFVQKLEQRFVGPLEAYLARHWPELTDLLDLQSATLLELLARYGGPAEVAAHADQARRLMRRVGGHFLKPEKIDTVLASAETTQGCEMTDVEREHIKYIAALFRESRRRSTSIEAQIETTVTEHEELGQLAEFAGARTALTLVAMLGSLNEYDTPDQLEKAQGLNLCERSSGQTAEDKRAPQTGLHISKRGSPQVRKMLYWLALRVISPVSRSHCPIATAWYKQRLHRNGNCRIKAVIAVMRKLTRALWWIARGQQYDGTKLFDTARLKRLGYL